MAGLVVTTLAVSLLAPPAATPAAPPVVSGKEGLPPAGPPGELWLPEVDSERIAVIDTFTNRVTRYIPMKDGAAKPAVTAITPGGKKIFMDNFGQIPPTVTVINRETGVDRTVPVLSTPLGAFTSADGTEIYLPEQGFTVEVMDAKTEKVVRRFHYPDVPVGAIAGPDGLMYVGFSTGFLAGIDPKTGAVVKPPIFTGGVSPFWYTFTNDGSKAYVDTVNSIGVIDMKSWRLVKTINTSEDGKYSPANPGAFTSTLSPDGRKLYVTMFGRPNVLVIDTRTDAVIREIPTVGYTPSIIFSDDGTRGYISDLGPTSLGHPTPIGEAAVFAKLVLFGTLGEGSLVVIDPRSDDVLGRIPTGRGPGIPAWVPPLKPAR
ncbi:hypothetical protein GCM10009551_077510 [Nocardiopsis tropica]|uniref:YncE family protein n=1 Tax=Tsukamurella strandjordii TaxID=147577 RepID=UPI0031D3E44C